MSKRINFNRKTAIVVGALVLPFSTAFAGNMADVIDDEWTEKKIESKILADTTLNSFKINVEMDNGTAFLTGEVDSEAEKNLVEAIAENQKGVVSVDSSIRVKGTADVESDGIVNQVERSVKDVALTTKIKTKMIKSDAVDAIDINVDTDNGVVTLRGTVSSTAERELAEELAIGTDGVAKINNYLSVVPSQ